MLIDKDLIYKNLVIHYLCIIIATLVCFDIFYWYENIFPFNYLTFCCLIFNIFYLYLFLKLKFDLLKLIISAYFLVVTLIIYPSVFILWQAGQVTAFLWYLLIPFGIMLIFPFRKVIYWSFYILSLIISILIFSEFAPEVYNFTQQQLFKINIITLLFSICFIILILYYVNIIFLSKDWNVKENVVQTINRVEIDNEKYCELYNSIVNYFEVKKSYRNPHFNITQLAFELGTNVTYISKALNHNKNMNYAIFINTYRINEIKEMLSKNYHNKYTLKFIYTSAGFKHQSTFNKIFKQIEGVTPSEYIKKLYNVDEQ